MSKRIKIIIVLTTMLLLLFCWKYINEQPILVEDLVNNYTLDIFPERVVLFDEFHEENFTCTGMTFDSTENVFWIADYGTMEKKGADRKPRLVAVDKEWNEVKNVIDITNYTNKNSNVQGIAYDQSEDIIWIILGKSVIAVDKQGNKKHEIKSKSFNYRVINGIAYDIETDSLWILCYKKYLYNISKQGELLKSFKCNLQDQDMIYLYEDKVMLTVGADFQGENNYIVGVDKITGEMEVLYRANSSYAIEGLVIMDDSIYVCNDGFYHNSKINSSYIARYSIEND